MIHSLMQTVADLPALPHALWLSPPERERLATFHIPKRREEWLLGRWTAKRLVRQYLAEREAHAPELYELSVEAGQSGAPEIRIERPALRVELEGVRLSISHSASVAFCALDDEWECVGADVERIEPRHPAFAGDYFTPAELHLIAGAPEGRRDLLITTIWSAKEAALKALCLGLTVDTRLVECMPGASSDGWAPVDITLAVAVPNRRPLAGWWRKQGGYVLTLATSA